VVTLSVPGFFWQDAQVGSPAEIRTVAFVSLAYVHTGRPVAKRSANQAGPPRMRSTTQAARITAIGVLSLLIFRTKTYSSMKHYAGRFFLAEGDGLSMS
jgi:hypothetical protein